MNGNENRAVVISQQEAHALFMILHAAASGDITVPQQFHPFIKTILTTGQLENRFLAAFQAEHGEVGYGGVDTYSGIDQEWADKWAKWAMEQPMTEREALIHSVVMHEEDAVNDDTIE